MVRTGARAARLQEALEETGLEAARQPAAARPATAELPASTATELLEVYYALGGLEATPTFRPGPWDLPFAAGLLVELDEELHFNRYRATTLRASWETRLPWAERYGVYCNDFEDDCVSAGCWGKRWTNPSTARMFSGGPVGDLNGDGAPRWKQRALYDAIKDTAPLVGRGIRLARVATHDTHRWDLARSDAGRIGADESRRHPCARRRAHDLIWRPCSERPPGALLPAAPLPLLALPIAVGCGLLRMANAAARAVAAGVPLLVGETTAYEIARIDVSEHPSIRA